MKLLMFLDDWLLEYKSDIIRRFPQASPVPLNTPSDLVRATIIRDEKNSCFRAWGKKKDSEFALYESKDGINWNKKQEDVSMKSSPDSDAWFYDEWDQDAFRRYKKVSWLSNAKVEGAHGGSGKVYCSADGIQWGEPISQWSHESTDLSDTGNNMFFNPFTQEWCIISRKYHSDRRVAMVKSRDLETWSPPSIILQPDVMDPPLAQFYGMSAILYEDDYFIGMLQCYSVPSVEKGVEDLYKMWPHTRSCKMWGHIDTQLTYSYDGSCWLRSDRSTLVSRAEPGQHGAGNVLSHDMVSGDDGRILIYSLGSKVDHGENLPYPEDNHALLLHALRKDGFAFIEPVGGYGSFRTRTLSPEDRILTVNYQAPVGQVLVQISDESREAIPGYSFQECIPLQGDELAGQVRWQEHQDISALIGKRIQIEFRLFDARVYAARISCKLCYTANKNPISRP